MFFVAVNIGDRAYRGSVPRAFSELSRRSQEWAPPCDEQWRQTTIKFGAADRVFSHYWGFGPQGSEPLIPSWPWQCGQGFISPAPGWAHSTASPVSRATIRRLCSASLTPGGPAIGAAQSIVWSCSSGFCKLAIEAPAATRGTPASWTVSLTPKDNTTPARTPGVAGAHILPRGDVAARRWCHVECPGCTRSLSALGGGCAQPGVWPNPEAVHHPPCHEGISDKADTHIGFETNCNGCGICFHQLMTP